MEAVKIDINTLQKENWSAQDLKKAKATIHFVQKIMNEHDFDYVEEKYGHHPYQQHNRTMLDGPQGVISSMRALCETFPEFSYDVKHIYVDGDYVTLQSHATLRAQDRGNPTKGLNIYDTWKIVGEEIVEHWDAVEGIDAGVLQVALGNVGVVRNEHTPF